MENLELTKQYAVVQFSKAVLENYNPSILFESDNIKECEDYEIEENAVSGCTIVEKTKKGLKDYYTGAEFFMNNYN